MDLILDGLVGPTHHFGGLSEGNLASMSHKNQRSCPKKAALEGLMKMKQVADLGICQGVLPPHHRPCFEHLRLFGFSGSNKNLIEQAAKQCPALLNACYSSSSMWAANSATATPSFDTKDQRLHLSIANLGSRFHRSIEPPTHLKILAHIFSSLKECQIHPPLPFGGGLGDEGANQIRLGPPGEGPGIHLLVYGKSYFSQEVFNPTKYPPRQSKEALEALCRKHTLSFEQVVFAKQNGEAVDEGVFHNDVISFGHQNLLIFHEKAFEKTSQVIDGLTTRLQKTCGLKLLAIEVKEEEISLPEAVATYLFNSMLLPLPDHSLALLAPAQCRTHKLAHALIKKWVKDKNTPISKVHYAELSQSMQNGGGPACVSLRVPITQAQRAKIKSHFLLTDDLYEMLVRWVHKHYPESLEPADLANPNLIKHLFATMNDLKIILNFPEF